MALGKVCSVPHFALVDIYLAENATITFSATAGVSTYPVNASRAVGARVGQALVHFRVTKGSLIPRQIKKESNPV